MLVTVLKCLLCIILINLFVKKDIVFCFHYFSGELSCYIFYTKENMSAPIYNVNWTSIESACEML